MVPTSGVAMTPLSAPPPATMSNGAGAAAAASSTIPTSSSSSCSPWCVCQSAVIGTSILATIATTGAAAAAAAGCGGLNAVGVAVGGGSVALIAQSIEAAVMRYLLPKRSFEKNVDRLGVGTEALSSEAEDLGKKIGEMEKIRTDLEGQLKAEKDLRQKTQEDLSEQIKELASSRDELQGQLTSEQAMVEQVRLEVKGKIQELTQARDQLQGLLESERAMNAQFRQEWHEKTAEIQRLTKQLEPIRQELEEARALVRRWEDAAKQISGHLSSLKPEALASDAEGLAHLIEGFLPLEQAFKSETDSLHRDASAAESTQAAWGDMLRQLQITISGLAGDSVKNRELLAGAEEERQAFAASLDSMKEVLRKTQEEKQEIQKIYENLTQNPKIQKIITLLESPDGEEAIRKAIDRLEKKRSGGR